MNPKDHSLFKKFPIQNTVCISTGVVPTPYHIYDGFGLFIGGTVDLDAAKNLLRKESLFPVQTLQGKALAGIWVCNFTDASLGPHHELQFSFFVSRHEIAPIPDHIFNPFALIFLQRDVQMLCHGLWNDTAVVVAYNREILSLDARQTNSTIERKNGGMNFVFEDTQTKKRIISGTIKNIHSFSLSATLSFLSRAGFKQGLALTSQPWISMEIINPMGILLNKNAAARAYAKNDLNILRYFDTHDEIKIDHPVYQSLNFIPQAVQSMSGYKFVYLRPE